jgi:hypothetical protein
MEKNSLFHEIAVFESTKSIKIGFLSQIRASESDLKMINVRYGIKKSLKIHLKSC